MSRPAPSLGRAAWALSALAAVLAGCGRGPDRLDASKEVLATLPGTYRRGSVTVAPDGRSFAYLDARADGVRVVANGVAGRAWVEVVGLTLSPEGRRVGFWATDEATGERRAVLLVVDGDVLRTGLERPGVLVFSPDGTRWAAAGSLRAEADQADPGSTVVWVDGREAGRWRATTQPAFTADATHVAWLALEDDGRVSVIVDGAVRRRLEPPGPETAPAVGVAHAGPEAGGQLAARWLSDGSLLTLAPEPGGWVLARDGRRLGAWPVARAERSAGVLMEFGDRFATAAAIAAGSLDVAGAAPVMVWWERLAGEEERWRVMRDGTPVDEVLCTAHLETQPPPTVSPDGRHVAYGCRLAGDPASPPTIVVADGRRLGPHQSGYGVAVSDGGVAAYAASDDPPAVSPGRWRYRVDGRPVGESFLEAWRPRLDPGGRRLAWEATPKRESYLGIDATRISRFDQVFWGPEFVEPREVAWVVKRGRKLARVSVRF